MFNTFLKADQPTMIEYDDEIFSLVIFLDPTTHPDWLSDQILGLVTKFQPV